MIALSIQLYFRGCPHNLFSLTPSENFLISICSLVCFQVFLFICKKKNIIFIDFNLLFAMEARLSIFRAINLSPTKIQIFQRLQS